MSTSQNGWPVLTSNRTEGPHPRLRNWIIPDANRHVYLRDGSAGFLLIHMALWWHEEFNPLDGGVWDEWGWAVRPIRGQTSGYSNHASGTAVDLDATEFPRGIPVLSRIKPANILRIHLRLRLYGGTLRWGGDYTSTPDGMHVEVNADLSACEAKARALLDTPRGKRILAANPGAKAVILS